MLRRAGEARCKPTVRCPRAAADPSRAAPAQGNDVEFFFGHALYNSSLHVRPQRQSPSSAVCRVSAAVQTRSPFSSLTAPFVRIAIGCHREGVRPIQEPERQVRGADR